MLQVDNNVLLILGALFQTSWRIVTSIRMPGTNLNVAELSFACVMIWFVLRHVPKVIGIRNNLDGTNSNSKGND